MTAVIARILPRASAARVAAIDSFVSITLFTGLGLLLSLVAIILGQNISGDGF